MPPTSNTILLTSRTRLCSDSKIYTWREGSNWDNGIAVVLRDRDSGPSCWIDARASFPVATSALRVCLWQLPDLHAIPRQRGDQQAIPLRVVADIGGAGDPADQFHLLARLVARHARIGPARHQDPATFHDDAVESTRALRDHARRLVAGLPAE